MRKKTLLSLGMLSAMALITVPPAFAQDRVEAKIPFAFNVGQASLPAGDYQVWKVFGNTLAIQDSATHKAAMALTVAAPPKKISSEAVLVFHKYGDRCFLSEVRTTDNGRTLTRSKLEREVAVNSEEAAEHTPDSDVYVAASVR
jgi:hypothetical protein